MHKIELTSLLHIVLSILSYLHFAEEKVNNMIRSVTHLNVPEIAVFKDVDEVAIAAASKTIYNINSKTLRNLAEKFVPIEGLDTIPKGFTIMHYTSNRNKDIKDSNNKVSSHLCCVPFVDVSQHRTTTITRAIIVGGAGDV